MLTKYLELFIFGFRMLFPSFSQESTFCVKFNYHMFGFHINELQLAKRSSSGHIAKVWSMVGEKGNRWLSAEVNVELTSSDQVRLGQKRPFHTQLTVSYIKTVDVLLTDGAFCHSVF